MLPPHRFPPPNHFPFPPHHFPPHYYEPFICPCGNTFKCKCDKCNSIFIVRRGGITLHPDTCLKCNEKIELRCIHCGYVPFFLVPVRLEPYEEVIHPKLPIPPDLPPDLPPDIPPHPPHPPEEEIVLHTECHKCGRPIAIYNIYCINCRRYFPPYRGLLCIRCGTENKPYCSVCEEEIKAKFPPPTSPPTAPPTIPPAPPAPPTPLSPPILIPITKEDLKIIIPIIIGLIIIYFIFKK